MSSLFSWNQKVPTERDVDVYDSPFRFLNLPGEIRNEIYKYIIAADAELLKLVKTKSRVPDHTAETCEKANRASTSQPALFRTCSQIRAESRGLFYHYHAFTLHIWVEEDKEVHKGLLSHIFWWFEHARREKSSLERVMRWLDAIGAEARR